MVPISIGLLFSFLQYICFKACVVNIGSLLCIFGLLGSVADALLHSASLGGLGILGQREFLTLY